MSRKFSPGSCRLPLMGSALALALAVADAHALGLGGLRVQSALNQPFVGEIALLDVKPDELDTVKVQIASADEFTKAGSERYRYLSELRFRPQISPRGETVIRVSSREPIREPYMDFLLEVTWPKGRLVKGYTVLLDPPVTDGRRQSRIEPPVVEPRGVVAAARAETGSAGVAPPPRQRQASTPPAVQPVPAAIAASAGAFPKHIGPIERGAGLWRLAVKNAPAGATAAQTAMALYRNSQDAFIGGNINRLIVGKTLVIPNAAELFALGPEAAQREFAAALRGEKVRRSPIADATPPGPDAESRLKIAGTAPEEPVPGLLAAPAAQGQETMEQELLLVREASESTRQETVELRDRIRELENQLGEIQQLLKLRNAELARMQGVAAPAVPPQPGEDQGVGEAPVLAAPPEVAKPVGVEPPMEVRAETSDEVPAPASPDAEQAVDQALERALAAPGAPEIPAGEAPATLEGPVETLELPIPVAESESPSEQTGSPAPVEGAVPGGEVLTEPEAPTLESAGVPREAPSAEPEPGAPVSEVARPVATQVKPGASPAETSEKPGVGLLLPWDDLLVPLAGAAGVTALGIGALAWVRARRRRASEGSYLEPEGLELPQQERTTPLPPKGGRQTAPGESPSGLGDSSGVGRAAAAPPSVFSALGPSQAESDEADVLSEADIYIAYGRYREAEELLREEIERTPGRAELKYKLAESYHGARNYPALDALMKEMQAAGEDRLDPERWQRLVDMAKAIEGLDRADAGVRPAALRGAPAVAGLGDRGGARSGEAFSLDISDARGPTGRFGLSEDLDDALGSGGDPSQRDVPVLRSSRPAPALRDDLDPLSLDLDILSHSVDLDAGPHGTGVELPLEQEPFEPEPDDGIGAVSDLELTIDDLRAASDVDLESFVDSTRTVSNLVDEPLSRQGPLTEAGGRASGPARLKAVTSDGAGADIVKGLSGSLNGLDEDGSSDLLSSQWQMDSGLWDETATKLDLARAYVEMGDQESARGILEEVVNEGNEEQRSEAAQILRALG